MRILIETPSYVPTLGGLERVLEILVREWRLEGDEVCVYKNMEALDCSCQAGCRSGFMGLSEAAKQADVVMAANSGLRCLPAMWLRSSKTVLQHHSDYSHVGSRAWTYALATRLARRYWIRRTANVAVSGWVRHRLEHEGECWCEIHNPVSLVDVFHSPWRDRRIDFLFVGRLVQDKGLDIFLDALVMLKIPFQAVIVGEGEDSYLINGVEQWSVGAGRVDYVGRQEGPELARLMHSSRWLVVPSRYEPFGLVAVEGLLAGCGLVVSDTGGLKPYVDVCAFGFTPDSAKNLSRIMSKALAMTCLPDSWIDHGRSVGERHNPRTVADIYRKVFLQVMVDETERRDGVFWRTQGGADKRKRAE